jgi:hypothetical protein
MMEAPLQALLGRPIDQCVPNPMTAAFPLAGADLQLSSLLDRPLRDVVRS